MVAGGRFVPMELREPGELARLPEPVVINCAGYGAHTLFKDESLVPVRGQIAWLIPQEGVRYKEKNLQVLGRRDGIVVQTLDENDFFGFGDADETPDAAKARADVELAATFFRAHAATAVVNAEVAFPENMDLMEIADGAGHACIHDQRP